MVVRSLPVYWIMLLAAILPTPLAEATVSAAAAV